MKSKCLCILAIDTSGSMGFKPNKSGMSSLALLNLILPEFIKKLKDSDTINEKLELCVLEIKEDIIVRIKPTPIKEVNIPEFTTTDTTHEKIRLGILGSFKQIKSWRWANILSEKLGNNYKPYIVLITDLSYNDLLKEEKELPFKKNIEEQTSKGNVKFYGIGIGNTQLADFFNSTNENLHVTNNPDFNLFFEKLNHDLSIEFQTKRPLFEGTAVLLKWRKGILFLFKKYFKKLWVLLIFAIIPFCNRKMNSKGVRIKIDKLIEVNNTEIKNYENIYPDNEINIKIDPERGWLEDNIKFVYDFTYNIENYELGAYMTNSSDEVDLSSKILLASLQNLGQNFKIAGEVYIKVIGETDAVPINNVIYRGELGAIKDKKFYVNGQWLKMTINDYKKLDRNIQLAFLRGYSVWDLMRRNCDFIISQKSHFQQVVKTNDNSNKIGGIYRHVKVEMIFYDVESITRAKVERLLD